ncbi:hypothetical protein ABEF95_001010 [Exophiala dermatitidis]
MIDNRCANPELQFDVDHMILEYSLYQAIRSHFDLLSLTAGPAPSVNWNATVRKSITDALRVLSIFDSFFRLFKSTHPSHRPGPEFAFNLDVLEFLVLVASRRCLYDRHYLADSMCEGLRRETTQHLTHRRRWLTARERQARRQGKQAASSDADLSWDVARDVESQIYEAWDGVQVALNPESHASPSPSRLSRSMDLDIVMPLLAGQPQPLLFDLIPRFMLISAQVAAVLGQNANEKWMDLVGQFMLQASLESLRIRLGLAASTAHHQPLPRLQDCFAWGYLDLRDFSSLVPSTDADDTPTNDPVEELGPNYGFINDLFCETSDADADPSTEVAQWTQIRLKWMSEFTMPAHASVVSINCRLDRLGKKYPLDKFEEDVVSFLSGAWEHACQDEAFGKPVLVQIEEGHLRGLGVDAAEFDEFMIRVGLKKDCRPVDVEVVRQAVEMNVASTAG